MLDIFEPVCLIEKFSIEEYSIFMLTKTDLSQIKGVVREEVETAVESKLEPIKKNLSGLTQGVSNLQKDMKFLKKKINKIDKTVDIIVKNYDEGDVLLDRRVKKIEEHLNVNQY